MKIAVSTGLYYKKPYRDILDIIMKAGFQNIELFLNQSFIDIPIEALIRELNKRGLCVTSIHLPLTTLAYSRNESEKYWLEKGIEYSSLLNSKLITTHFHYPKGNRGMNNDKDHFELLLSMNPNFDFNICTENLPYNDTFSILQGSVDLEKTLEKERLFLTFDTTHLATHNRNLIEEYIRFRPFIKNIYLSDYSEGNEHKVIGTGDLPIKEFIKALKRDNYTNYITIEYDFENSKRNTIENDSEAIKHLNESLRKINEYWEN